MSEKVAIPEVGSASMGHQGFTNYWNKRKPDPKDDAAWMIPVFAHIAVVALG